MAEELACQLNPWQSSVVRARGKARGVSPSRTPGRTRRTGVTALAVLAATVVATLVLARRYHLDAAAAEVVIIGGLPGLYLAWAAYRDGRRVDANLGSERLRLGHIADELAAAIQAQWKAEAAVRRLNDPYPLPVRWVAAESDLASDWSALVTLATTGAGWPVPSSASWADSPAGLTGQGDEIAGVLGRVPTGRLVMLGEPGTGKTMLLVRLLLDLLACRQPGGPVPVLVSMASWDPATQGLHEWLISRLVLDYRALEAPASYDARGTSWIRTMLAKGQILMILDGLDEMPKLMRGPAIGRINDAMRPGQRVVLSSRGEAYRRAVRPEDGSGGMLHGAAVIELCPLESAVVSQYLMAGVNAPARWEPVLVALGTDAPIAQALTTPLAVTLARTIYNPRPGSRPEELRGTLRDPAELCSQTMANRAMVMQRLFDAFIPATYESASGPQDRRARAWTVDQAQRWFVFLARHIERSVRGSDFAWWQLADAIPQTVNLIALGLGAAVGLASALIVVAVFSAGPLVSLLTVPIAGLAAACAVWLSQIPTGGRVPMSGVRWMARNIHRPGRNVRVRVGLATLLIAPLPELAISAGPIAGLGWTVICLVTLGLRGVYGSNPEATSPQITLSRTRRSSLIFCGASLIFGPAAGLVYGYVAGIVLRATFGPTAQQFGLTVGLVVGLMLGLGFALVRCAWLSWGVARIALACTGRLPWALVSFLDDAHKRGVLRQAGAFYQFRHMELQRQLAGQRFDRHASDEEKQRKQRMPRSVDRGSP